MKVLSRIALSNIACIALPRSRWAVKTSVAIGVTRYERLSGKGRITVWRGTPGSSAPRERLHSALVRHGWVTIKLNRTLHPGRTRLVLIASNRMVIMAKGAHKPSMRAG